MIEILVLFFSYLANYIASLPRLYLFLIILAFLYFLYYRKFRYFVIISDKSFRLGRKNRGKSLPAFPNGWFMLLKSKELKKGKVKYVETHGESLAVYRGNNGTAYVVDAYCPHLGANLAVGGKVVHESCIQCPFHAWTFDGETGNCVVGKDLKPKEGISYEYEISNKENLKEQECDFKVCDKDKIKIKKYPCIERCGFIYAYFDNSEHFKKTGEINYEPLDVSEYQSRMENRGYSNNLIECHMAEIYENTADQDHLIYIHGSLYTSLVKNNWQNVNYIMADEPDFEKKIAHENPIYDAHRKKLVKDFVTEKNKKYLGFYLVEATICLGNFTKDYELFCATGIQVGGGISYIFVVGKGYELFWMANMDPKEKFKCYLRQEFYAEKWMPYLMSAFFVYTEQQQVLNDKVIFDNKRFPYRASFNDKSFGDGVMVKWFKWYSQFFDGCKEYEEEKEKLRLDW